MFVVVLYSKTIRYSNTTDTVASTVTTTVTATATDTHRITHDAERFPDSYISVGAFYNKVWNVHDVHIPRDM